VCVHVCVFMSVGACLSVCACVFVCAFVRTHKRVCVCACMCIHVRENVCAHFPCYNGRHASHLVTCFVREACMFLIHSFPELCTGCDQTFSFTLYVYFVAD
jgi:hypothetical protein